MSRMGNKTYMKDGRKFMSDKMKFLMREGKPGKQAISVALSIARKVKK